MAAVLAQVDVRTWGEEGSRTRWLVEGGSMWPALRDGDVVVLAHGAQPLRVGDIVLYRAGEQLVLHRLLRIEAGGMLSFAGDVHGYEDPPVRPDAVIGRAVAVEHAGAVRHAVVVCALDSRAARIAGRAVAASHPLRRRRGLRTIAAALARACAWLTRR